MLVLDTCCRHDLGLKSGYASISEERVKIDVSGEWDSNDWKDLGLVITGCLSSSLFMGTFGAILSSGLLVGISPCTWFLSLPFLYVSGSALIANAREALSGQKILPSLFLNPETGAKSYKSGVLVAGIGFITAWYGMLDFMYRHLEDMIVG